MGLMKILMKGIFQDKLEIPMDFRAFDKLERCFQEQSRFGGQFLEIYDNNPDFW